MVGYNAQNNLTPLEFGFAAAFSGATTRFICQPIDVIKIRFQLQVEPLSSTGNCHGKYQTILQAFKTIIREEGVSSLWKGHVAAQLLSFIYGVTQALTKELSVIDSSFIQHPVVHFGCGALATSTATVTSFPFDVIRTRFVAQGNYKAYHHIPEAIVKMYVTEGYRSFYKGLSPTIIQSAPYGGAQFFFYNIFSQIFSECVSKMCNDTNHVLNTAGSNALAGFCSGICSKTIVYPLDVCRKRLQIQGFQNVRGQFGQFTCNGLLDCACRIFRNESVWGFYKGLQPSLLKASLVTALNFTLYEHCVSYLGLLKK